MAKATPEADATTSAETAATKAPAPVVSQAAKALDDPGRQAPGETISPVAKVARTMPKQLASPDIQPAGSKWQTWTAMAHAEHTIEDVLNPRYLWSRADQIGSGDTIEVKHIHGKFLVVLDIVAINRVARGIVANIRHVFDYTKEGAMQIKPALINARIEHLGARGWAVIEGNHVARDGFDDRQRAEQWLDEQRFKAA